MNRHFVATLEAAIFGRRRLVLAAFALLTVLLGVAATGLRTDAGFARQLPLDHPYMRTFHDYRDAFGGTDQLLIAVRARDGDVFDARALSTLERVTDAVSSLPEVDRSSVRSLFTPGVRFVEVVENGLAGGDVVPADFTPTPEAIRQVRANVLKAGIVGRLVADDFSAAMVRAELLERDPATRARLDHVEVARSLEETIRAPFVDDAVDVHIVGFAKAAGDVAVGATEVLALSAVAVLVTAGLVRVVLGSWALAVAPLACSLVAVVWTLGLLRVLGFGIDPMSILLPGLVFAVAVSHGVQTVAAAVAEAAGDAAEAARRAFRRLLIPGAVALLTDAAGFLTVLLIDIPIVREFAITASIGVSVVALTNLILLPAALSLVPLDGGAAPTRREASPWQVLSGVVRPRPARIVVLAAVALFAAGLAGAQHLRVGHLQPGVPELRADSRFNRDAAFIGGHFAIGVDLLQVMVETVPDGCVAHDVMTEIDRFQWHMANVPGVRSTHSLAEVAKTVNAGWNAGSPKWRVLPRDPRLLAQAVAPVATGTGLLNADCSVMPVLLFTEDHRPETIDRIVAAAEAYKAANDGERHTFRLAAGNLAVMAATNDVVEAAQAPILLSIYAAVVTLCLATFRSVRATLCIVLPLCLVSVLAYALMVLIGIGLKPTTLAVAAVAAGIGVDYGIYVFARIDEQLRRGVALAEAWPRVLEESGRAIPLAGLVLAVGVGSWTFSDLRLQADMGLLLAFVLLANMLAALVLLPALAALLYGSGCPAEPTADDRGPSLALRSRWRGIKRSVQRKSGPWRKPIG